MTWTAAAIAVFILLLAVPYVAGIRHPRQRLFTAYVVFVTTLCAVAVVLFLAIGWLARSIGLATTLGPWGLALMLLVFGLLPAIVLATWLARKPPPDRSPPD